MLTIGIVVCAVLFAIGAPITMAFALGGLIILMFHAGLPLNQLGGMYFDGINSFILLAGPLFILAGNLMTRGGMGKPLLDFLGSFTNRIPGGVAISTIITCTFIGALTGSSMATLAAVGIIMFPAMIGANYDRGYSGGVLCSAANLGNLIPPSIMFILYGYITEQSVAKLFMAGVLPGLLMAALLSVTAMVVAKRKRFPLVPNVTWSERGRLFIRALPSIFMPIIILGGIYGGIFTPTEAAAVACVYCLFIGVFVYRGLNWKNFWASLKDTVQIVGMILLLIAGGMFLGKAFIVVGFPQAITSWVTAAGLGPMGFLLLVVLVYLGLGCVMEGMAIMFVVIPLVVPAAAMLDISLIHLGVVFCVSILVAGITPPVSVFLYATCGMFDVPTEDMIRGILPFLAVMIIVLFIITLFPEISTWLPGMMLGG